MKVQIFWNFQQPYIISEARLDGKPPRQHENHRRAFGAESMTAESAGAAAGATVRWTEKCQADNADA
jgi:hypothetical protein